MVSKNYNIKDQANAAMGSGGFRAGSSNPSYRRMKPMVAGFLFFPG
jgi:hypothetical protein